MPFFVCDVRDLQKHGETLLGKEDAPRTDSIQAALNYYEQEGLTLLHVIPEYHRWQAPGGTCMPTFVFKQPDN